jgi:acyl-CoA synthetase (AMP-forming)/AMP-acid ligase II
MLSRILDACSEADGGSDVTVPQLRSLAYGGAPMPRPVIERALALWPNVDFVNAYGLTETSSTVAVLGPEDHRAAQASDDPHVRARLGSVGRVLPAVEIEIRDEEGELLGAGEVGRIWIKGDQVSAEYAGSGPAIDKRGFFDTRDQGYLDEGAYLFIGGRADDTIIRGAENIAPAEIEDVLLNHPDITDAVVVGVPDEEWGQRLEAAVVRKPGSELDESGVREYVRSILRGSKTPDRVVFWPELPRTVTGKLLRRQALEALTQPQGADSPS